MDKENTEVKNRRPEWKDQELRNAIYQGLELEDYKIARDGLCISYRVSKVGKPLEWSGAGVKGRKYAGVSLMIPDVEGVWIDRNVCNYNPNNKMIKRTIPSKNASYN